MKKYSTRSLGDQGVPLPDALLSSYVQIGAHIKPPGKPRSRNDSTYAYICGFLQQNGLDQSKMIHDHESLLHPSANTKVKKKTNFEAIEREWW